MVIFKGIGSAPFKIKSFAIPNNSVNLGSIESLIES